MGLINLVYQALYHGSTRLISLVYHGNDTQILLWKRDNYILGLLGPQALKYATHILSLFGCLAWKYKNHILSLLGALVWKYEAHTACLLGSLARKY
jgi:hypothetical protein